MNAALLGFVFVIIGLAGFVVLTAVKAWKYAHLPVHSRVELYPVPKEGDGRGKYGGSYFEEEDWWEKPRRLDPVYEVVDIMQEMLLISKLFKHQRSLWWASYAFHLGIYVMFGWSLLLLLTVFWNPEFLVVGTAVVGAVGFALSTIGAVLLLVRRAVDESLRAYTPPQEYFNILLILATLVTGIVAWTLFASPFDVARSVFAFDAAPLPPVVVAHLVLLGIMLLYIPLSKMSHYVGKFFAFHKVLWDNDPNVAGSKVAAMAEREAGGPAPAAWSAPHTRPSSSDTLEG
ncbi:respiratory nitrate reductase subunit gamma [Eggerthella guodeyinii]|uniref:Respiratory nitrate reductase subunit gamma n=2 Tax=Eggerthella TaxID=84111 RepID=A0A6L7ISL4_9ACTN|nr:MULTISPECIES: respiratory nitrate reductase subunit gamma [Eggerthella]MBC5583115.1 respiratory nitrate reductase subunit gamma [Eggerthella hominis]QOS66817.1 respiratory nitrate reductase subunit gamma [Eggerthella guodeyinii]